MPRQKEVDAWFARYTNPMKPVVQRMRETILAADPRVDECIKWQAPTFMFMGNLASFFPKSKQHASLMFHLGAKIPGKYPRLQGNGNTSRVMKIGSVAEADAARAELKALVKAWCAWRQGNGEPQALRRAVRTRAKNAPNAKSKPKRTSRPKRARRSARG
jgi:hypothetical protein